MASTNITTFPGKVGISNANPTHTLAIGSNVYVDDTGVNKLVVNGNISATGQFAGDGAGLSNIQTSNVIGLTDNVTRIGTLETDLSDNSSRIGTLETDLTDNVARIGTLETDLSDNSSRIGTLETDLSDNSSRITSIESGEITITGVKTFQDDIILESNLRVQGDLLVANTVNMTVSDPILELGSNNLNTGDVGLVMTRHGAANSNVTIVYDESEDVLNIGYTLSGANDTTIELDSNALAVNVQGALTVASIAGDGSALSGIQSSNVSDFASNVARITDLESSDMTIGGEKTFSSNLEVGTANLFVDTTTGNVGVGTAAPGYALDVYGTSNVGALTATSGTFSGDLTAATIDAAKISNGTVGDSTGGIKAIYFDNTEQTGYYTDKSGILAFDENFYDDTDYGTGTYDPSTIFIGGNGGGLLIKNQDGWGAIFTSQNTRWAKGYWDSLAVSGSASMGALTATSGTFSGDVTVGTANLFVDTTTGNVGVGTAAPGYALDVVGTAHLPIVARTSSTIELSEGFIVSGNDAQTQSCLLLEINTDSSADNDLSEYAGTIDLHIVGQRTRTSYGVDCFNGQLHFVAGWNEESDFWQVLEFIQETKAINIEAFRVITSVPRFKYKYIDRKLQIYIQYDFHNYQSKNSFVARVTSDNVGDITSHAGTAIMETGTDVASILGVSYGTGGNVGIGTASPVSILHVKGTGQTSTTSFDTSQTLGASIFTESSDSVVGSGGSLLFGTYQGKFAAIKAGILDGASNTMGNLHFMTRNATGDATLTNRMTITNTGDVGIGTVSPGAKLHVNGDIYSPGVICQTQQYEYSSVGTVVITSGTLTLLNCLFTPKFSNSKILIQLSIPVQSSDTYFNVFVDRGSTRITSNPGNYGIITYNSTVNLGGHFIHTGVGYDLPGTTSQISYNVVAEYGSGSALGILTQSGKLLVFIHELCQ